ncbi:MAG: WYL domain-containing protein [Treponema sp.]|jgi:predicted DNA-binding transcriptional regulator YafY|nr:WYL domain-containing protein [Treponema sp.]
MKTEKKLARKSLRKTALPRIYRIEKEIASGKFPNSDGLARLLETSISTISRDIEFMRDQLGAPIEYDALNRGYYFTEKTFRLPASFTSAEDLLALCMARSIFSLYRETPLYEASQQLLESITTPIASDGNNDWLENRIAVPPIASAKVMPDIWEIIVNGLKENRIITFDYKGTWDEDYKKRRVHPYQLLFDSGVWYLYGFSEERKAARIFSLSKIKNAGSEKNVFSLPKNFKYADFSGDSYFGVYIGQEKKSYAINCYEEAAVFAADRQWAADQKIIEIKDGISIEFTSTQYDKVLKWVLSNGCNAVPKKPKRLVEDWKWHIQEMQKIASNGVQHGK